MPETAPDLRKRLSTSSSVGRRLSSLCVPSAPHGGQWNVDPAARPTGVACDVLRHREDAEGPERGRDFLRPTASSRQDEPLTCGFLATEPRSVGSPLRPSAIQSAPKVRPVHTSKKALRVCCTNW